MNERLSYDELYITYKEYVYEIAFHILQDEQIALDVVQDVFFKFYTIFEKTHQDGIKTWLNRCATNRAIDYYNYQKNRNETGEYAEEYRLDGAVESPEDELVLLETDAKKRKFYDKVTDKLMVKNPKWYEAVLLCYYMDLSQKEAAEAMDITIDSLKSMLQRAKKWAMKEYGIEYHEMAGGYES